LVPPGLSCGTCGKPICDCSDRAWIRTPDAIGLDLSPYWQSRSRPAFAEWIANLTYSKNDAGRDGSDSLASARPLVSVAPFHNPGVTDQ
jgi:hypothetical protein